MKENEKLAKRLTGSLVAGALALFLLLGLSLLLSRYPVVAQPLREITADLVVDKQVDKTETAPGETLLYTITVYNPNTTSIAARMTDILPAELSYVSGNALLGNLVHANGVVTYAHALAGLQTDQITFTAEITSGIIAYAEIENTVQFTGTGKLITDSVTTEVVGNVGNLDNAGTYKQISADTVESGDILTFTIRVTNEDVDQVPGAQFTDPLPDGLTLIDGPNALVGDVGFANGVITWSRTMPGLSFDEVSFSVQATNLAPDANMITNTVEFVAPGQSFTRSASVQQLVGRLQATKTVYPIEARPGEYVNYAVHLVNVGDGKIGPLWMTDELPSEVSFVADTLTANRGVFGQDNGVITWTNASGPGGAVLMPTDAVTINFAVQIDAGLEDDQSFTNTAKITGTGELVEVSASAAATTRLRLYFPIMYRNYPPAPYLNSIAAPVNRSYNVNWDPVDLVIDHYVLQQSRYADFTSVDNSWQTQSTSRLITSAYCGYYYRVRADKADEWGDGPWGNVQAAQASPPDLTLYAIPDPGTGSSYAVSWTPSPVAVDRYVLQESKNPDFTVINREWQTTLTSQQVDKSSGGGTFYYRVRADDDDCWGQGTWSEAKSVTVQIRWDFNSSCPEWAVREHTGDDGPSGTDWFSSRCQDGKLKIWVNDRWEHVIASPLVMSPDRPYEIQTSIYFQDRAWSSGYALIFGIKESQVVHYYRINVVYLNDGHMKFQVKRCEGDHGSDGETISKGAPGADASGYIQVSKDKLNGQQWNTWRVQRVDDHIKIIANNNLLLDVTDGKFTGVGFFGLMVSTWEFKPASILVDYYNVVPLQ